MQAAECRRQTACAVLMFRCLPDAVLRFLAPLSSVSTSRGCILSYWFPFGRIFARTTASVPLDPRPCLMPTDPIFAVESHLEHHIENPYLTLDFGLAWPSDHSHIAATATATATLALTLCRQSYVPLDLVCLFTRPVKVLASVIDSHIYPAQPSHYTPLPFCPPRS